MYVRGEKRLASQTARKTKILSDLAVCNANDIKLLKAQSSKEPLWQCNYKVQQTGLELKIKKNEQNKHKQVTNSQIENL